MAADEARRRALVRAGNPGIARAAVRDGRAGSLAADRARDLRIGLRGLRRNPGLTAAVVVSLALGVGGTTAMYGVAHAILIRPLPYADADRLFLLRVWWNSFSSTLSNADLIAVREQIGTLGTIAAFYTSDEGFTLSTPSGPAVVDGGTVTPDLPAVLGAAPLAGPGLSAAAAPEALISEGLWRDRFDRSPAAIGAPIVVDGVSYAIAGVMPAAFNLPGQRGASVWLKANLKPPTRRGAFFLGAILRLAPSVTPDEAAARLTGAVTPVLRDRFGIQPGWHYGLRPLKDAVVGEVRDTLHLLGGAMALVLLIAIVNVSNLLLARGSVRTRELAIRASLESGSETACPSTAGRIGAARMPVVPIGSCARGGGGRDRGLSARNGAPAARRNRADRPMVAFAFACGLGSGLVAGALPALRIPWRHLPPALGTADRSSSAGSGHGRLRQGLVVAELALTVTIVAASLLVAKSLFRLEAVDPGFRPDGVLTFRLAPRQSLYANEDRLSTFLQALDGRLRTLPGVSSIAFSMALPPNLLPMSNNYTSRERPWQQGRFWGRRVAGGVARLFLVDGQPAVDGRPFARGRPPSAAGGHRQRALRAQALSRRPRDRPPPQGRGLGQHVAVDDDCRRRGRRAVSARRLGRGGRHGLRRLRAEPLGPVDLRDREGRRRARLLRARPRCGGRPRSRPAAP